MDESETTRLRALCDATELPWRAVDVVDGGTVLGRGTAILRPHSRWLVRRVAEVDMGDGEECDTSHAALIVSAVNALPGLLDAAERAERAERERDDLAAVLETRTAEHALAMARVRELEAILAGRSKPPTDDELVAMETVGLRLARRWHAVDKAGNVRAFPTAEVSRG